MAALCPQMLTGRARVEAEDAQRVLLAALNGLAGLMLLEGDPRLAVATYRQAGPRTPAYDCVHLRVLLVLALLWVCVLHDTLPSACLWCLHAVGAVSKTACVITDGPERAVPAQALAEGEANKALVHVDPLQRLHTLTNLAALLGPGGGGVPGVPRTLRDSELLSEAGRIREARRLFTGLSLWCKTISEGTMKLGPCARATPGLGVAH